MRPPSGVTRGLDPRVHPLRKMRFAKKMDCTGTRGCPSSALLRAASRVNPTCGVKPGNDGGSSHYLARRYKLYAEPRPAPTCGLVLMNSSSVSLSTERVCSVPSQFGNVLAVNFIVNVCFSSSTV